MHRVCISSVAGETLDLELPSTGTIAEVKLAVANSWSIPKSCQKLLTDDRILEEEAIIERLFLSSTLSDSVGSLFLTLVVTLDVVRANLNSQDGCSDIRSSKRVFALQELGMLGLKGGQAAIGLVVNCLEEKDERVYRAAIDALTSFATKGNQDIIAALMPKLKHKRCQVKKVALEFLGKLTEVGDQKVINGICACLEQHVINAEVTTAAIEALCLLALQGDQDCIVASLTNILCHKSKLVRKVAVQALVRFSQRGISIDISALSTCLVDTQSEVRVATLKAIAKIARKGDQEALTAVSVCIADTESSVRLAALCAMAEIAEKGDDNAFSYSRLLGAFKRKGLGCTSTSSDEGTRPCTPNIPECLPPKFAGGFDSMSQSSAASHDGSAISAPSSSTHGLGDGHGDCSGGLCQRSRDGRDEAQRWWSNLSADERLKCNMQ